MGIFGAINAGASGLSAQRIRMDIISQNIANAETTRTENGEPYRRKIAVFEESNGRPFSEYLSSESKQVINKNSGVKVARIVEDTSDFKRVYEPSHPDADKDGYVSKPNVDILTEMVNMISATRSYEANVTSINAAKSMAMKALEIGNK